MVVRASPSYQPFYYNTDVHAENLFVVDTHKAIIDRLAKPVWEHASLKLGAKVTQIKDVSVVHGDLRARITVQEAGDDRTYEFDEVVVAVPLGCLKRNSVAFSPRLPSSICTAIENASISSLEKVFIAFPKAFWDSESRLVDTVNGSANSNGEETDCYFPGFADFLNPSYAPPNHESFALEVNPMSNPEIFGDRARPTLLYTLFGDSGQEPTSAINSLSLSDEEYFRMVNDFVKPYYSRLPNYDETKPECTPTAVVATNWQNDDLAGNGSYTNFKVSEPGREAVLDEEVRVMRRGLPERGIWLAGEHVAPFIGLGTSTGAFWSGESVAMRILGANGIPLPSK